MSEQLASERIGRTDSLAPVEVRIATGVGSANQCIARIGAKIGIFTKHGISITFPRLEVGGPESVAGLLRAIGILPRPEPCRSRKQCSTAETRSSCCGIPTPT